MQLVPTLQPPDVPPTTYLAQTLVYYPMAAAAQLQVQLGIGSQPAQYSASAVANDQWQILAATIASNGSSSLNMFIDFGGGSATDCFFVDYAYLGVWSG